MNSWSMKFGSHHLFFDVSISAKKVLGSARGFFENRELNFYFHGIDAVNPNANPLPML